jgi:hypothetical protein
VVVDGLKAFLKPLPPSIEAPPPDYDRDLHRAPTPIYTRKWQPLNLNQFKKRLKTKKASQNWLTS